MGWSGKEATSSSEPTQEQDVVIAPAPNNWGKGGKSSIDILPETEGEECERFPTLPHQRAWQQAETVGRKSNLVDKVHFKGQWNPIIAQEFPEV